ncbi:MAG: hypothetical protein WA667_23955 [Candidatus Nitrosopolaris sp.]
MLGELILEHKGITSSLRVLDAALQKREITVIAKGRIKEIEIDFLVTYWNIRRDDGTLYGEGQGIISNKENNEAVAIVTEYGIGRTAYYKVVWRGSAFYRTTINTNSSSYSKNSKKLSSILDNTVGIFETDVDESGNVTQKVWEWK